MEKHSKILPKVSITTGKRKEKTQSLTLGSDVI